jgi:uncharacterized protein (TIGR02246 family)
VPRNSHIFVLLLYSLSFVGCEPQPGGDSAADEAAIKSAFAEWVRVSEAGDATAYSTYITDDALFLGPDQPPVVGKAAIQPWVAGFFADWQFSFPQWTEDEVIVAGDVAIHRYSGVATLTPRNGGAPVIADRKYMDVLRKEADGQWRVARHMFNLNR